MAEMQVLFCDTQISHAPDDEMSAITNDPDFLQLMCEAGGDKDSDCKYVIPISTAVLLD